MINKIYKRIHNKYSDIFNFFFFLRYLLVIFLIACSLFAVIPKFFNYENKKAIIEEHLISNYGLKLQNYSSIKFNVFPRPNLSIKNATLKIKDKPIKFLSNNINIFLNLKNIYNYENFKAKKIKLEKNEIQLDVDKSKYLINYFKTLKYKIDVINLSVQLIKNDNPLIKIKNISFSNYGYRKYRITGEIFNKKFMSSLNKDNKNLNFKILKTGLKANFEFDKKNTGNFVKGSSKIFLLNNLLRFNFKLDENRLEITKSNFRNKDIKFSFDSLIKLNPFFKINSNININDINKDLIFSQSLEKILENKEIVKKIDSKININFKSKKYFTNLINNYNSDMHLAYGRIVFSKNILITGGEINCQGEGILIEEFPRLNFVCSLNFKNKKNFFKKLKINKKVVDKLYSLNVEGSLNLFNRKINFKKINTENGYTANEEDIKFFKEKFDSILFNEGFFKIFKKSKIRTFVLEIL